MLRFSVKPGKQLLYMYLQRDSRLSEGRRIGVDFGCQRMYNYQIFQTAEYYGVDLDENALVEGVKSHPKAKAIHSRIEDADVPPADFAACINVFYGSNFEDSDEVAVLESIISKIAPGGILLITLVPKKGDIDNLMDTLNRSFEVVDEFPHDLPNHPYTLLAPVVASWHMLRNRQPDQIRKLYCRCVNRLQVSARQQKKMKKKSSPRPSK